MAKIFVDLITPGNGKTYEFRLDDSMTVKQFKQRISEEIIELENGNITLNPERTMLCNLNTRALIPDAGTLKAAGVKSGQSLLLI